MLAACGGGVGDGRKVCPLTGCAGWSREIAAEGADLALVAFTPPAPVVRTGHLMVYIEGDGRAWETRTRLSADPTPRDPVALRLALADPWPDKAYLGRPCQYLDRERLSDCSPDFWSSGRFSAPVLDALGTAVDRAKARAGARRLTLIGFSGGGVAALLLAARRDDVADVVTIAAPLDHGAWTSHHSVSRLERSLSPIFTDWAQQPLCQVHLLGAEDDIVPPSVAEPFLRSLPASRTRWRVVPGYAHNCCWADAWPGLIGQLRDGAGRVCPPATS